MDKTLNNCRQTLVRLGFKYRRRKVKAVGQIFSLMKIIAGLASFNLWKKEP